MDIEHTQKTWFIAGAGGGIGNAPLNAVLDSDPTADIIATHRAPISSTDSRAHWLQLDLSQPAQDWQLEARLPHVAKIDVFVNCCGLLSDEATRPEKRISDLAMPAMLTSYQVNAAGPVALFSGLSSLIAAAPKPVAAFLSAQVGSIEDNRTGGWYSYRMAKAALNMGVKCLAIETARWKNPPLVIAVHPGTTQTPLSRPFTRRRSPPPRPSEDTAARLLHLLLSANPDLHGRLITTDGTLIPW